MPHDSEYIEDSKESRKWVFSQGGIRRTQCLTQGEKYKSRDMDPAVHLALREPQLSGPLNWLNASLLQPFDRHRAPSAIGSAIGMAYLALSRIHAQVGVLNCIVLNHLKGSTT